MPLRLPEDDSPPASDLTQPVPWMAGFTVVEAAVAAALAVAVLAFTMGSLNAVGSATRYNQSKLHDAVRTRDALWALRSELERTSMRIDTKTGKARCEFHAVGLRNELLYRTVVGASAPTGELGAVWSAPARLYFDADAGALVREFEGRTTRFGANLKDARIEPTGDGRIRIEFTSEHRRPGTSTVLLTERRIVVRPLF